MQTLILKELPIYLLTCTSLNCGRKSKHLERIHTCIKEDIKMQKDSCIKKTLLMQGNSGNNCSLFNHLLSSLEWLQIDFQVNNKN